MSTVLKISEAATLALHAVVFLAENTEKPVAIKEITSRIPSSEAHLSKVLQRLVKDGIVKSIRGPKGGFLLGKSADKITRLDVYESIDGPLVTFNCLFDTPICKRKECILGLVLKTMNLQFTNCLSQTRLSQLTGMYK